MWFATMKLNTVAIVLLVQAAPSTGLVDLGERKLGTVAEREFVDPAVSAVASPVTTAKDTLPALMGLANMDVPKVDNPFGPSGTSINKGLGLGTSETSTDSGPVKKIYVDSRSGIPAHVDLYKPILPGNGMGNSLLWSVSALHDVDQTNGNGGSHGPSLTHLEIEEVGLLAVKNWFHENDNYLSIDSRSQLFQDGMTRMAVHGVTGGMIQLSSQRTFRGLLVKESRATATVKNGNLINVGLEKWGQLDENFVVEPTLTEADAIEAVREYAGREVIKGGLNCKSELIIFPLISSAQDSNETASTTSPTEIPKINNDFFSQLGQRDDIPTRKKTNDEGQGKSTTGDSSVLNEFYEYKLVWKVCPIFVGQTQEVMEAYVDAHTSYIYSFLDTVDYFNNARGGVYPTSSDGEGPDGKIQLDWPMPYMYVGDTITTTGGNYEGEGSMTATYSGPYLHTADNCGRSSLTQADGINWGSSGGTDCATPGYGGAGNTHSSRTGFYELNKIMEIGRSRLPDNIWLQRKIRTNMNINDSCNAFFTFRDNSINFYRDSSNCRNTGEISGVLSHEWGHGLDYNDVTGGISAPSGEGVADLYAALRSGDSCIGRGFSKTQTCSADGRTCFTCTGVRDIDYMQKEGQFPFTHSRMNSVCGSGVHCMGHVYSEAVWDLYKRHLKSSPYNYDDNTAMEIVTRLTYIAAGNVATWFSSDWMPIYSGCFGNSGYHAYLAADDDDGNVNNGTPHMTAIYNAFNDHEIACPNSYAIRDAGCLDTPTSRPNIIEVAVSDAQVTLSWAVVPNANKYQVLRTEGVHQCAQGKVLLGETSASELIWTDTGLQNGREYYYLIVPKGEDDSCYGPSSECITAIPSETKPSIEYSMEPSMGPSTPSSNQPSAKPSLQPSLNPSESPSHMTLQPSNTPSSSPSKSDAPSFTSQPSSNPSSSSSQSPSQSFVPSSEPSSSPPSSSPSLQPTVKPSHELSTEPSLGPSISPSTQPISRPSLRPSLNPSLSQPPSKFVTPSLEPSGLPTLNPSLSPSQKPSHDPTWSKIGCPMEFVRYKTYDAGEAVTVNGIVYECLSSGGPITFCGATGFEPGSGMAWTHAWELKGSCTGTISPTSSPVYPYPTWTGFGCPEPFDENVVYKPGQKVSWNGLALECKEYPESQYCNMDYFVPGDIYQNMAWNVLGTCSGSIAPTASPIHDGPSFGECPDSYVPGTSTYTAGTQVERNGLVYECTSSQYYFYCPYFTYAPGTTYGYMAWNVIGWCD